MFLIVNILHYSGGYVIPWWQLEFAKLLLERGKAGSRVRAGI